MSISFKKSKTGGMSIRASGKDAQALFDAMAKPTERAACAVRGQLGPQVMCGSVIVGGEHCGSANSCVHQVAAKGGVA